MSIFYCSHSCTFIVIFVIVCAKFSWANRTLELSPLLEQDNMARHGVLPPVPVPNQYFDSTEKLRREYHLEDFLWAGSGDGPTQSDPDGGLAWEDSGAAVGGGGGGDNIDVIRVTKTMVLFKTVLTTVYPIEMTPTIIYSPVTPTPRLITLPSLTTLSFPSPSHDYDDISSSSMYPSPTQTFIFIEPTASLPIPTAIPPRNDNNIDEPTKDMSEAASDRLYWVQTIIKANGSAIMSQQQSFQGAMQKHLARIYASAFKRHLMQSLGVLDTTKIQTKHQQQVRRRKRSNFQQDQQQHQQLEQDEDSESNKSVYNLTDIQTTSTQTSNSTGIKADVETDMDMIRNVETQLAQAETREDFDTDWYYLGQHFSPSKMRSLATTAMNVTVSILNISQVDKYPHVSLNYIVCAEGNPVPAASAVQDLSLVTKQEMEREIGYEVINKAEALVASPLLEPKVEMMATSPWLIVAIISICVMAVLVLVIMYMVWKWKNNRLGDGDTIIPSTRPQSGIEVEGGIINQAFGPPSPIERSAPSEASYSLARHSKIPKSSTYTSHKLVDESMSSQQSVIPRAPRKTQQIEQKQQALASELNTLLSQREDEEGLSPSSIKSASSSSRSRSSIIHLQDQGENSTREDIKSGSKFKTKKGSSGSEKTHPSIKIKSKSRSRTPSPRKKVANVKRKSESSSQEIRRRQESSQKKSFEGDHSHHSVDDQEADGSKSSRSKKNIDLKDRPSPRRRRNGKKLSPSELGRDQLGKFPGRLTIPSLDEHLQDRDRERDSASRSIDKITYGNLDICQDSIARPISAKAKKLLPRPKGPLHPTMQGSGSVGGYGGGDGTSISSSVLMDHEWTDNRDNFTRAKEMQKTIDEMSDLETEEDDDDDDGEPIHDGRRSTHEQDRDLSESFEKIDSTIDSTEAEPPTKDVEVQTPTRRWKGSKSVPKKKRIDQLSSESLISTESEEVIEVHHLGLGDSSSGEINPLGKMRKRFHQFLDDAFNIMGKKDGEDEGGRSKSAKVSISHHVETRETNRPWTSHLVREDSETLHRLRPKSASFGPPKRAWTSGSERRCHSAKSNTGSFKGHIKSGRNNATIFERGDESEGEGEECDVTSTAVPKMSEPISLHHHPTSESNLCTEPIFPHYPIYADIPIITSQNQQSTSGNRPRDPAAPLIRAIQEEIKRFEKVKVTEQQKYSPSKSSEP